MKKLIFTIALAALTINATQATAATYDLKGREHYGFGIEFIQCMAKVKFFPLVAPVCAVIAGVDAVVNPPEKYHPEQQITTPEVAPAETQVQATPAVELKMEEDKKELP